MLPEQNHLLGWKILLIFATETAAEKVRPTDGRNSNSLCLREKLVSLRREFESRFPL